MSKAVARRLRKNMTDTEKVLWRSLRSKQINNFKFRRQAPIGKYIVDFVCFEQKLVIELDGGQHSEQINYDRERSLWLENQGFRILRFWNHDVLGKINIVLEEIVKFLTPHLNPPPQGGRKNQES